MYYYIDYRQTIDAIKWRVYKLGKDMQVEPIAADERKEYFCLFCKAQWTLMEVLDYPSDDGFRCHRCDHILNFDPTRNSAGHEKVTKLNNQLRFVTDLLLQIDKVVVPDNNFEAALRNALPVERDAQHQIVKSTVVDVGRPTSVKGVADTGPKKIDVNISASDGPTAEQKEAERLRKEKISKENALPHWMAQSTVTGDSYSAAPVPTVAVPKIEADIKESRTNDLDTKQLDLLEQIKLDLMKENAEAAAKAAEEEESDEEDDDEFEDVPGTTSLSAGGTPASSAPATANLPIMPSPLRQASAPLKREASPSGDSAFKTGAADSDDRPAKKVKVEEPAADNDDDEDDMEFEDV